MVLTKIKKLLALFKLFKIFKKYKPWEKIKNLFTPKGEKDMKVKNLLTSKKGMTFLVGTIALFLTQIIGLDPDAVEKLTEAIQVLVGISVGGESLVDVVRSIKQPTVYNSPNDEK